MGADPVIQRVAVVTPYWQESEALLNRCLDSVRGQTYPVTHFLVSDGAPRQLPESDSLIHIRLPFNIGNSGATPRGIGAQLAFNMGYDAVAFLDADNWYEPDHIAQAMALMQEDNLDVALARRRIFFPDGEVLQTEPAEDASGQHIDTNCFIISRRAAFLVGAWMMWPKEFGTGEDRMMTALMRVSKTKHAHLPVATVWYLSNWLSHYKLAGKKPVAQLHEPKRKVAWHFEPVRFKQATGIGLAHAAGPRAAAPRKHLDPAPVRGVVMVDVGGTDTHLEKKVTAFAAQGNKMLVVGTGAAAQGAQANGASYLALPDHPGFRNTALGIGAVLAFQSGCDLVALLANNARPEDVNPEKWGPHFQKSDTDMLLDGDALVISVLSAYLALLWAQTGPEAPEEAVLALLVVVAQSKGCRVSVLRDQRGWFIDNLQDTATNRDRIARLPVAALRQRTGLRLNPS